MLQNSSSKKMGDWKNTAVKFKKKIKLYIISGERWDADLGSGEISNLLPARKKSNMSLLF